MSEFKKLMIDSFGKHNPGEIEELILDDFWKDKESFTTEEKTILEEYSNLIHLSLNNIGLKSLKNLPSIKVLYVLSLNNNNLNGDDFDLIPELFPNLNKIKISKNNIEKIENFSKLEKLRLRKIEVKENPFISLNKDYKEKLFNMLPTLEIVDQQNKEGEVIETTDYHEEEEEDSDEDYNDEEDNYEIDKIKNKVKDKDKDDDDDEENYEEENEDEDDNDDDDEDEDDDDKDDDNGND